MPQQASFRAPSVPVANPQFLSSCLVGIRGITWTVKALTLALPSLPALLPNLLHFPGWDSVAVVGLQTQQENERRNAPTLLVGTSICICFKKTYLFLCISLALEPHLGKGYLFHFALHHVYILTFSTLLFHSPSCCPLWEETSWCISEQRACQCFFVSLGKLLKRHLCKEEKLYFNRCCSCELGG